MFCEQCGTKLPDYAKFCSNCGNSVGNKNDVNVVGSAATDELQTISVNKEIENVGQAVATEENIDEIVQKTTQVTTVDEPILVEHITAIEEDAAESSASETIAAVSKAFEDPHTELKKSEELINEVHEKKEGRALKRFLSVIVCIFLFVTSFMTVTVMTVRSVMNENTIYRIVKYVDVEDVVESGALGSMIDDDIKHDDIKEIYEDGTFKNYVNNLMKDYAGYILTGEEPKGIRYKDVKNLVKENEELIYEVTGKKVTERDYKEINEYFDKGAKNDLGFLMSDIEENTYVNIFRMSVSVFSMVALIVISLMFVVLLFVMRKYKTKGLLWNGITLALSSVAFMISAFVVPMMINGGNNAVMNIVKDVFEHHIAVKFYINGAIMLFTNIMLIAVYVVIRMIKNAKVKKA